MELQDGTYQVYRKIENDSYWAMGPSFGVMWAGIHDRERKEFNVWFHRSDGNLVVTMAEEMGRFRFDRDKWMEELINFPTMHMDLREEKGQLVFEKFTVDCRKKGEVVTGEIVRYRERGVADVRVEAEAPSGGKVTIWHEGEEEAGFSFWGIFAGMPLPEWGGHLPTVAIRPRLMPRKLIYWAPSVEDNVLFTDGWETDMMPVDLGFSGEINSTDTFKHRGGFEEVVKVKRVTKGGEMKMDIERQLYGLPDELSCESFFAPTHLTTTFPLVFPKGLTEVVETEVGEELAGELVSKMVGLRALLEGIFPEEKVVVGGDQVEV